LDHKVNDSIQQLKQHLPPTSWIRGLPWVWMGGAVAALMLSSNASSLIDSATELLKLEMNLDAVKEPTRLLLLGAFVVLAVRTSLRLIPHFRMLKDGKVSVGGHNPMLAKALLARDEGRFEEAYVLLEQELLQHPKDGELIDSFWDVACACGRCPQSVPTLMVAVQALINADVERAMSLWIDMSRRVEEPPADARLLVKIGTHLREADHLDLSDQALARAVDGNTQGLTLGLVLKVVELTQEMAPGIAAIAARRALRFEALDDEKRDRMVYLLKELQKASVKKQEEQPARSKSSERQSADWEKRDAIEIEPEEEAVPAEIIKKKRAKGSDGLSMDLLDALEKEGLEGLDQEGVEDAPYLFEADEPSFEASEESDTELFSPGRDLSGDDLQSEPYDPTGIMEQQTTLVSGSLSTGFGQQEAGAKTATLVMDRDPVTGAPLNHSKKNQTLSLASVTPGLGVNDAEGDTMETQDTIVPEFIEDVEAPDFFGESEHRFNEIKTMEATPLRLGEDGISMRLGDGRQVMLSYPQVKAVAVAAVLELADKPVAIIDLVMNWGDEASDLLRVVRFRSDSFDPRTLSSEDTKSVSQALRNIVRFVMGQSGAKLLPTDMEASDIEFRKFRDVKSYQREIFSLNC